MAVVVGESSVYGERPGEGKPVSYPRRAVDMENAAF